MKNPHSTGLLSSFWNHAILPRTVLRVLSVQLCFVRDSTSIPAGAPALGSLQQQLQQERTSILFSVDGEDLSPAVLGGAEENSRGRRPGDTESVSPAGRRVLALEYGGLRGTRRGDGRKKFAEVGGPDVAVHVRGSGAAHHDDNNKGLVAAAIASSSAVEREKAPPKSSIRHAFGLACLNFGMLCFLLSWTPQLIFNVLDTRQLPTLSLLTQCFILASWLGNLVYVLGLQLPFQKVAPSLMVAFGVWVQQVQLICSYEAKIAKLDQHVQTEEEQAGENPQEFSESASSTLAEDVDNEEESSDIIRHRRILVWRCFYFLVSYTIVCVALIIYLLWEERVVPLENRKEYWARNWIAEFAVLPVVVVVSQMMGAVAVVFNCCLYWPQIINNFLTKTQGGFHAGFLALDGLGNCGALFAAWGLRFPAVSYIAAAAPLCQDMLMLSQLMLYRRHDYGDAKNGDGNVDAGSVDTEEGVRNVVGGGTVGRRPAD